MAGLNDLEHPRLDHTLYPENRSPPAYGMDPSDGLPHPVAPQALADAEAPALSAERFVCMADTSAFVLRDPFGRVLKQFEPERVERTPEGKYRLRVFGVPTIEVQPIRPQCRNYWRQLVPWGPQNPDSNVCHRYCSLIKDEDGEFVDLRDQELLACELRNPPDPVSNEKLDAFDRKVIETSSGFEHEEFDVVKELAKEGGIFSAK